MLRPRKEPHPTTLAGEPPVASSAAAPQGRWCGRVAFYVGRQAAPLPTVAARKERGNIYQCAGGPSSTGCAVTSMCATALEQWFLRSSACHPTLALLTSSGTPTHQTRA